MWYSYVLVVGGDKLVIIIMKYSVDRGEGNS
jgi:hypothetical protein